MKAHATPKSSSAGSAPRSARPPPSNRGKAAVAGTAAPTTSTAPAEKKQKYTVIITNVENDFAKLHSACIPHYSGLRGDYEETHDAERLVREGGRSTQRLIAAQRGCSYAVRCRTETRTAEVSLFGPADADFTAMQLVKPPRRPTPAPPAAKRAPRGGGDGDATSATEPAVVVVPAPAAADAGAADSAAAVPLDVGGVERLALRLRRQRYFEEKLPVSVHLPGRAADEVLVRLTKPSEAGTGHEAGAGGDDEDSSADDTSEEVDGEEDEEDGRVGTPGAKRAREDVASGAEAATAEGSAPALQRIKTEAIDDDDGGEDVAKPGDEKRVNAAAEGETREKEKKPRAKRVSKAHTLIKQFPSRQKDFVSAVAALSTRTPLRRVRRRLHDLPGYLSCWTLYDRHLRVVFRDAESLFKAKQLLDQFELEAGLRVSLTMSDPLSRTNAEFTRAQESENAME